MKRFFLILTVASLLMITACGNKEVENTETTEYVIEAEQGEVEKTETEIVDAEQGEVEKTDLSGYESIDIGSTESIESVESVETEPVVEPTRDENGLYDHDDFPQYEEYLTYMFLGYEFTYDQFAELEDTGDYIILHGVAQASDTYEGEYYINKKTNVSSQIYYFSKSNCTMVNAEEDIPGYRKGNYAFKNDEPEHIYWMNNDCACIDADGYKLHYATGAVEKVE